MIFTIKSGQQVEINVGSFIKGDPRYLDDRYDNQWLEVIKIEDGYPFVRFEKWTTVKGANGQPVDVDEISALSPEIIEEVQ